jgi:hypothetical protein
MFDFRYISLVRGLESTQKFIEEKTKTNAVDDQMKKRIFLPLMIEDIESF